MGYDFGKVFNRFDVNKNGKLDEKEAQNAMKAGYFAAKDMDKGLFEVLNNSNPRSIETYKKETIGELLNKAEQQTNDFWEKTKNNLRKNK